MEKTYIPGNKKILKKDKGHIFIQALILLVIISSITGILLSYEKTKLLALEKESQNFYKELYESNLALKKEAKNASR